MRVAVIQMNQGSDKAANIGQARRLIEGAIAADRPDMVSLPETWTNLGGGRDARFAAAEALPEPGGEGGAAYEFLREGARAPDPCPWRFDHREGSREALQHLARLRPRGAGDRALSQDPPLRHHRAR